jgi:hypothetical protein
MTALIGDVIIPLSHGFDLGPFILGCALASIVAFTLATLNRNVGKQGAIVTRRNLDRIVRRGGRGLSAEHEGERQHFASIR